jgi:hypothetical protein
MHLDRQTIFAQKTDERTVAFTRRKVILPA